MSALLQNEVLLAGCAAWLISQVAKTIIFYIINKQLVWERLLGDGGMPSSHSAIISAIAVSIGLHCGWDSPLFALAIVTALIVMHDARGVRQETGKQARIINDMLELFEAMGSGEYTPEETLKEFVGHTQRQVVAGSALGILVAVCMYYF
ncbi:MAG: divergent PAP2 family protein [Blautia sp.]|nr:divergent PAP2 family protein [Blautia sp.]